MSAEEFIRAYEQALASQDWRNVEPLVHENACVTFSNGTVHKGKPEVKSAFEKKFSLIKDEKYSISNVHGVKKDSEMAVYVFDFSWSGMINDRQAALSKETNGNFWWSIWVQNSHSQIPNFTKLPLRKEFFVGSEGIEPHLLCR